MINPLAPDFTNLPSGRAVPIDTPTTAAIEPVVSILTPFFNTDEVFLETAACLRRQTFRDWEWIIVDDGSTSAEALAQLDAVAAADCRVRVVHRPNGGPAAARNTAFGESHGRYLCLIDSDDLIEPTYLETCIWFLESQTAFGFCNSYSVIFGSDEYLWTTGFEQGRNHLRANSGPPISVLRRTTFEKAGGFDEQIVFGHEDWDFWLRVASCGIWGYTIPEYLQWYRKRSSGRFSQVMSDPDRHADFEELMHTRYAAALENFPAPRLREASPYEAVDERIPFENRAAQTGARDSVLFLFPWLVTGGADRVNLDWIEYLRSVDWRVTVCATLDSYHDWQHEFARLTDDVFVLSRFLHRTDYLRFIAYCIESRGVGVVVISGSTAGYLLLPYLRARFPCVAFVDLCHVEEPHWLNGGHPRFGVGYQAALHANIVTTGHLKDWMTRRGARADEIDICYTGAEVPEFPSPASRAATRARYGLATDLPLIIFGGRLTAQKRPLMLVDILGDIARRSMPFNAVIVGDGELRTQVETRCDDLRLRGKVVLAGSLSHTDWLAILGAADILLMPSAYEGISVALFEAMARGVVPVVGRVGGQAEVVDSGCGTLIDASDLEPFAYAEALVRYLQDAPLLRQTSANARRRIVDGFSKQAGGASFVAALSKAIQRVDNSDAVCSLRLGHELAVQGFEYLRINALADYLWSKRDAKAIEADELLPSVAATPGRLTKASRILVRIRVSRPGIWLARSPTARMLGRRVLDWLERKPGF